MLKSWPWIFWFLSFFPASYMRADNRGALSVGHSGSIVSPSHNVLGLLCLKRFFLTHGCRNINQMNIYNLKSITMWNLTEGCLTWGKLPHNMKSSATRSKETWTHPPFPPHLTHLKSVTRISRELSFTLWAVTNARFLSLFNFKGIWRQVKGSLRHES